MTRQRTERGALSYKLLLVLILLPLLAISVFTVYRSYMANNTNSMSYTTGDKAYLNLLQRDGSARPAAPSRIAHTNDQQAILTVLHAQCSSARPYITVDQDVFENETSYKADDSHARIAAGMCDNRITDKSESIVATTTQYLHKDDDGAWQLDQSTSTGPDCFKLTQLGYSHTLVPECR